MIGYQRSSGATAKRLPTMPTGKPVLLHSQVSDPSGGTGEMGRKLCGVARNGGYNWQVSRGRSTETEREKKKVERRKKIEGPELAISDNNYAEVFFFSRRHGRTKQGESEIAKT